MTTKNTAQAAPLHAPKKKRWTKIALIIAFILLSTLLAISAWQLQKCHTRHQQRDAEIKHLQTKVDTLTAKLNAQLTTSESKKTTTPPCDPTVTEATKTAIRHAMDAKDYTSLQSLMTNPIKVILAASEGQGPITPAQAVLSLNYFDTATTPWNFALPTTTITSYEASFYHAYFDDNTYVGKSGNSMVVSFDFDTCGKITSIFIAASDDLLL